MQPTYDTNETGNQRASLGRNAVVLTWPAITRMGLSLAGTSRPPWSTGMPANAAGGADKPPFANTEAGWRPPSQAPDGVALCGFDPMCNFSSNGTALHRAPRTHTVTLEQQRAACRGNAQIDSAGRPTMRLADFIDQHMPVILSSWESFAASLPPVAADAGTATLRDHAAQILQAIVQDLRTVQSLRGQAIRPSDAGHTAAQTHAVFRATCGFTMQQMIAEYRALRAGVLQRWLEAHAPGPDSAEDVVRFNEAIDQAITESVDSFCREVERWRNLLLGVLGHDLRAPLNAILLTSQLISRMSDGTPLSEPTARLIRSGNRMKELLDALLDYNRTALDMGIRVRPTPINLATVCREEIEVQRAALPDCRIEFAADGATQGCWDASRMKQVVSNLVTNAARYGDPGGPVVVTLSGGDAEVRMSVENPGPTIPRETIESLFEPLRRGVGSDVNRSRTSMGLGLFIVRQVAQAHGGTVTADSADGRTVFKMVLPRVQQRTQPEPDAGLRMSPVAGPWRLAGVQRSAA
jgi:signal transduction histidine kinase